MYIPLLPAVCENAYLPTYWLTNWPMNILSHVCQLDRWKLVPSRFNAHLFDWEAEDDFFHAFIDRLSYHFQFLSEGTYGSFSTGYQFFQVLVSQFLSGPAFSCTLPAPLKFCLQVNFGWLSTTFAGLLHFPSNHLQQEREDKIFFLLVPCLQRWLWLPINKENIYK